MSYEREPDLVGTDPQSTLIPGDIILGTEPDSRIPTRWSHVGLYIGGGRVIEAADYNLPVKE